MDTSKAPLLFAVLLGLTIYQLSSTLIWLKNQEVPVVYSSVHNEMQEKRVEMYMRQNTPVDSFQSDTGRVFYLFADGTWETNPLERVTTEGEPKLTEDQVALIAQLSSANPPSWMSWLGNISDEAKTVAAFNEALLHMMLVIFTGCGLGLLSGIFYFFSKRREPFIDLLVVPVLFSAAALAIPVRWEYTLLFFFVSATTSVLLGLPKLVKK